MFYVRFTTKLSQRTVRENKRSYLPGLKHATSKLSKLSDRPRTIHLVFLFFNIENEGFASSVKENIGK